ncbi:MAG: HD domain-containing phosphohydrolase, partial [Desulfobacteraceae bacterium]
EFFFEMAATDEQALYEHQTHMLLDLSGKFPRLTADAVTDGMHSALVLPVFINHELKGTIALGFLSEKRLSDDDLTQARQISDQVAVALSNARLVAQLEKLNLGTLEALARTVDAKSAWTAGHSERVTHLSVKIARVLGLADSQVEILRRAAYLHDIGKIGIPLAILDKPGRLTDEEFEKIKEHPVIGARILEPIEAYADVLAMIHQHHEKYDGKGYPDGLSGEEITLGARIMAVADVYDAVVSDRPYRQGWIEEKAIEMITRESGTHFDPRVVDAFLLAVSQ